MDSASSRRRSKRRCWRIQGDEASRCFEKTSPAPGFVVYYASKNGPVNESDLADRLSRVAPVLHDSAAFARLESLPKTASGKIDRGSLPAPSTSAERRRAVAPRDEMERSILRILEDVLQRSGVGVHDDFFSLGAFPARDEAGGPSFRIARQDRRRPRRVPRTERRPTARRLSAADETLHAEPQRPANVGGTGDGRRSDRGVIAKGALPRIDAAALTAIPAAILPTLA